MSTQIAKPEKSVYWSALSTGGDIEHSGRMDAGLVLDSGQAVLVYDEDSNTYLDKLNGQAMAEPLPAEGAPLNEGEIYSWSGQNVIVRQSHNRTTHDPDTVPALFSVYREDYDGMDWIPNESVMVGDERTFEGSNYACLQSHTTQSDWTPPSVPSLWTAIVNETGEWQAGVSYVTGQEVTYLDTLYSCIQSHTSQVGWEPPVVPALWGVV